MTTRILGPQTANVSRDEEGHRTYKIKFLVQVEAPALGPTAAMLCPGLPVYGDYWNFDGDVDVWAFCKALVDIKQVLQNEPNEHYTVEFTFTSKPDNKKCKDQQFDDPLTQPPKVSGAFSKFTEEAVYAYYVQVGQRVGRFGGRVVNSAFEQIRGKQNEWDFNRPTVTIEQNVPMLQLFLCSSAMDHVNSTPMWGLSPRMVKLDHFTWEKKFYGKCYIYYTRKFTFSINYSTWDRYLLDEGTKCLKGHWSRTSGAWVLDKILGVDPDPNNPSHYIKFQDRQGNNCRVILDGAGKPWVPNTDDAAALQDWWCLSNGTASSCFPAFCKDAVQIRDGRGGVAAGWVLKGPFTGDANCSSNCAAAPVADPCAEASTPGQNYVARYFPANMFLLGIPSAL